MNKIIIATLLVCASIAVWAQDIYMPIEYRGSYDNGTRTFDGKVSDKYWQNSADYNIKAKVDPVNKLLVGDCQIKYHNNSPDSLTEVVFHAYHDYYKPGASRARFFAAGYNENLLSDGMVLELVMVANDTIDMKDKKKVQYNGTNYMIELAQPLPPNSSVNLRIKWHYSIPGEGFERSGAIDNSSMFIAYWYPEMAVYDDINGWDRIRYDASSEFYHDNSNFKVEIEVPENFVVWASVALVNKDEVYPDKVLERLDKAAGSTESVAILGAADYAEGVKMKSTKWKFEANEFRDFSFALSDRFYWDAGKYEDKFGYYFLNNVYDPEHTGSSSVIKAQQKSLEVFHNDFPAYPFPFKNFTIFNGLEGGGMEFPGMANNASNSGEEYSKWIGKDISDYEANLGLTLHEMFHMYFPFLMGINEKRYGWMDEGYADFADHFIPSLSEAVWNQTYLGRQYTVPMMVPTYTMPNHSSINTYTVGSYSYYSLYYLLGEEVFKKSMKEYIDRWKNKHPLPYDYMFTFNDASGQDLSWFWQRWYFDWAYPDLAIKDYKDGILIIENVGGRPLAFTLTYKYQDESEDKETISPIVWKDKSLYKKELSSDKEIVSIKLTILGGSDTTYDNNTWTK